MADYALLIRPTFAKREDNGTTLSHGPTKFPSKGACIYCGASGVKLSDEHIVPLSLGGRHIIVDASCDACSKITSKFEQDVARELWGDARASYNAPTRRKRQRKTHIILADPKNRERTIKVPYKDYPAPIIFYKMARAGLLEGLPETLDISAAWKLEALSDAAKNQAFKEKYGIELTAKFRHVPQSFARLIAKIGYGQVLSMLDPVDFRPICLPFILGQKENLSYIVGGATTTDKPDAEVGYRLSTLGFGTLDRMMFMAEIRLFANNSSPTYHVAVGDVLGRNQVTAVLKKLGEIEISLMQSELAAPTNLSKEPHWVPAIWPLPFWRD